MASVAVHVRDTHIATPTIVTLRNQKNYTKLKRSIVALYPGFYLLQYEKGEYEKHGEAWVHNCPLRSVA